MATRMINQVFELADITAVPAGSQADSSCLEVCTSIFVPILSDITPDIQSLCTSRVCVWLSGLIFSCSKSNLVEKGPYNQIVVGLGASS